MENTTDSSLPPSSVQNDKDNFPGLNKRFFVILSIAKYLYFLPGSFCHREQNEVSVKGTVTYNKHL
ncbi:hypothetical protein DZC72_13595 [Maribacter algicola]|uniref:Uncharacterized protein n=1 Tax=Maribacter algicola TaxID=2498892 RepID=A0A3R8Q348_9FLAO|nr:hypothetical protein [Maribacter algicola]RRQ48708.1 hypothetical protein DZC72_13595 [Maribacter algicola]